ncbi:META domain-containing protein [Streptomyces sp. NPDC000410]|uniref:META domain-containing protein n=1 Tax=Streptomyces sp. NPDC000410 TaxID=3154254 RepID=UPI00331DD1A5
MRIKLIVPVAATLGAVLTLAGCGTEPGSDGAGGAEGPDSPVTGVHWTVDSVTVGGKKTAAPGGAYVEIDTKGRAKGNYGCNHFRADATVEGDTVTVGPGDVTMMSCEKPVQDFEDALNKAFSGELKAKVSDQTLTLTAASGDSIALTSQPAAPLVGTRWSVTALLAGEVATSLPAGTEKKAHLTFGKDGSVRGSLGCNTFNGTAKVSESGSTITFGRLSTTRRMCPGPEMDLERELAQVLKGEVTYEVRHRGLSLTAANGKGLSATAQ